MAAVPALGAPQPPLSISGTPPTILPEGRQGVMIPEAILLLLGQFSVRVSVPLSDVALHAPVFVFRVKILTVSPTVIQF